MLNKCEEQSNKIRKIDIYLTKREIFDHVTVEGDYNALLARLIGRYF